MILCHRFITCFLNYYYYISREAYPRRNVYWSRPSVCLCVCLPLDAFPHYCTDLDVTWRMVEVPPNRELLGGFAIGARVALLWQHSASAKCQRVLVLALCLVIKMCYCNSIQPIQSDFFHSRTSASLRTPQAQQQQQHQSRPTVDGRPSVRAISLYTPAHCYWESADDAT